MRTVLAKLAADASALFGDRRGGRALHEAADAYKKAREDRDARSVVPRDWRDKHDEQTRVEQVLADHAAEAATLRTEQTRLERLRRTAPWIRARATAREALAELG